MPTDALPTVVAPELLTLALAALDATNACLQHGSISPAVDQAIDRLLDALKPFIAAWLYTPPDNMSSTKTSDPA